MTPSMTLRARSRVWQSKGPVAGESEPFPEELRRFVNEEQWTYAKTMPEWPHEYLVRDRVDGERFEALVRHIRSHGYEGRFYKRSITYHEESGLLYWTMGAPLTETTIINRCRKKDSFEFASN